MRDTFIQKWTTGLEYKYVEPEVSPYSENTCEIAYPFEDWCRELVENTGKKPSETRINQNLLFLQKVYFERYEPLAFEHKCHISPRSKRRCLYDIYRETYLVLNEIRLSEVSPPILRKPPKALPHQPPMPRFIKKRPGTTKAPGHTTQY